MIRSLYAGASAMEALTRQHELIASNLANVNSTGFRRAVLAMEEKQIANATDLNGTRVSAQAVDFNEGSKQQTGSPLNLAIGGDGFFSVETPDGPRYTRSGSFHRDPSTGQLVNDDGYAVNGGSGPLTIDPQISDEEIVIEPGGGVSARGQLIGTIGLTKFADNSKLVPDGQVYFKSPPGLGSEPSTATLMQGYLEGSNVRPVTELINLILTSRMFEASQQTVRTIGDTIQLNFRV